jgi:hypothetical protein
LANFIRYPAACGRVVLCFIANERNFHYERFWTQVREIVKSVFICHQFLVDLSGPQGCP